VNLAQRSIAPTELRRFSERFSPRALVDESARAYREQGLAYLRLDDEGIVNRLLADQSLLLLPLVRSGNRLTVGLAEDVWREWLAGDQT